MDKNSPVYILNNTKNAIQNYVNWNKVYQNYQRHIQAANQRKQQAERLARRSYERYKPKLRRINRANQVIDSLKQKYGNTRRGNKRIAKTRAFKNALNQIDKYTQSNEYLDYQRKKSNLRRSRESVFNLLNNDTDARLMKNYYRKLGGISKPNALQRYQEMTDQDELLLHNMKTGNNQGNRLYNRGERLVQREQQLINGWYHTLGYNKGYFTTNSAILPKHNRKMIDYHVRKRNRANFMIQHGQALFGNQKKRYQKLLNRINRRKSGFKAYEQKVMNRYHRANTIKNLRSNPNFGHIAYIRPRVPHGNWRYVYLFITSEAPTHSNSPTTNPIEHGRNISTGTQMQAPTLQVNGLLANNRDINWGVAWAKDQKSSVDPNDPHQDTGRNDYLTKHKLGEVKNAIHLINHWVDDGTDMYYSGNDFYPNCDISSFTPTFDRSANGAINACQFTMTITQMSYFDSNVKKKKRVNRKGKINRRRGKQHGKGVNYVIAKGNNSCYYEIARHTGCKLSWLRKHNKYPDRRIPYGAKIYYQAPFEHKKHRKLRRVKR